MKETIKVDVLSAWVAWDAKPGAADTAATMEAACTVLAAELGLTTTVLRAKLAELRRGGMDRYEAIALLTFATTEPDEDWPWS